MLDPATVIGGVTAIGSVVTLVIKWQYDKRSKSGRIRDTEAEKLWDVQEQIRHTYQEYAESLEMRLQQTEAVLATVRANSDALLREMDRSKALSAQMVSDLVEAKQELEVCHAELLATRRKLRRVMRKVNGDTRN